MSFEDYLETRRNNCFLSPHFSEWEFINSPTAIAKKIDNRFTEEHRNNAIYLCVNYLEPLRTVMNKKIVLNSGYRRGVLNKLIKGSSPTSAHTKGLAVDIKPPEGLTSFNVYKAILELYRLKRIPDYDQLIIYPDFLHLGIKEKGIKGRLQTIDRRKA